MIPVAAKARPGSVTGRATDKTVVAHGHGGRSHSTVALRHLLLLSLGSADATSRSLTVTVVTLKTFHYATDLVA